MATTTEDILYLLALILPIFFGLCLCGIFSWIAFRRMRGFAWAYEDENAEEGISGGAKAGALRPLAERGTVVGGAGTGIVLDENGNPIEPILPSPTVETSTSSFGETEMGLTPEEMDDRYQQEMEAMEEGGLGSAGPVKIMKRLPPPRTPKAPKSSADEEMEYVPGCLDGLLIDIKQLSPLLGILFCVCMAPYIGAEFICAICIMRFQRKCGVYCCAAKDKAKLAIERKVQEMKSEEENEIAIQLGHAKRRHRLIKKGTKIEGSMMDGISRSKNRVSPQKGSHGMHDSIDVPTSGGDPSDGKYLSPEARARRSAAAALRNNGGDEMGIATVRAPVPDAYLPPSLQNKGSPTARRNNNAMNDDFIIAASPSSLGRLAREQSLTPTSPTIPSIPTGLTVTITPTTPTNVFGDGDDGGSTNIPGSPTDEGDGIADLPNRSPSSGGTVTNGRRRQYRTVSNNTINTNATGSGPNSLHSTPRSTQSGGSNLSGGEPADPVNTNINASRRTLATVSQRTIEPTNAVFSSPVATAASRRTLATTSLRTLEPGSVVPSRTVSQNPTPISGRTPTSSAPSSARRSSGTGGGFVLH